MFNTLHIRVCDVGSSFIRVNSVPAGHICAIYNLEVLQLKTVTLCNRRGCMPLRGFGFGLQLLVPSCRGCTVEASFIKEHLKQLNRYGCIYATTFFNELCHCIIFFRIFVCSQHLIARNVANGFFLNRGVSHCYEACCIDDVSRGSLSGYENV